MNEFQFETALIKYIKNVSGTKQWQYQGEIRTTAALWDNFKKILEAHNQDILEQPLSFTEFNQVKKIISDLRTPYHAGQFLYGLNGVSQIEIDLDDDRHVFLTVFNQKHIGAGDTIYQVVNQIERPAIITGKLNRRFDTTLLINGLPIIQIEEKTDTHDVNEALNQMHQYAAENQYRDIFSTLQILVAITPNNVKYMANTPAELFNKDFAFNWQRREDNTLVRNWKDFADSMLSIPMAHQMATNYMILDGTKNKQMLKVMRPYQVYATQNVIEGIKRVDFTSGNKKVGYIWHTTGSGKTITSFKTAWLASRLPNVDKVVFVVDRIALTKQTGENYHAYDPDGNEGCIEDTKNTTALHRKLKSKDNNIIITSVQKLGTLVNRKSFKSPDKNIVFIVDEAHRSTGGENFALIQNKFKRSVCVGYTGTPMFDELISGRRTEDIFGPLLHAYTIREAIADRNVLGFKVDFQTTIDEEEMKTNYLPNFYRNRYPSWTDAQVQTKIDNLTDDDIDDAITPSFYDENPEHIRLVVADIFKNWRNRSNQGKYNALFTTRVGGGRASTPMAMMYFDEFQRVNSENKKEGNLTLKVAITFSQNTSNNDTQLLTNQNLHRAINVYNKEFGTSFGMDDTKGYTQDVTSRLNKTAVDKNFLDIVVVIDQLLTGFDAPDLNTLYVDRTLRSAGLIQAYSRTNRIADMQEKPWGRIINYRWPIQTERLMNDALAIYANKDSANLSDDDKKQVNIEDGVIAKPFDLVFDDVTKVVDTLRVMTKDFTQIPPSEKKRDVMLEQLNQYNIGMAKLKQFDQVAGDHISGFDYDDPDSLINALGMTSDEESMLTTVLSNELKQCVSKDKGISIYQIELKMTHVKDIKIDYDYLTELLEDLLNYVHTNKTKESTETRDKINQFANGLSDLQYARKIKGAAKAIFGGHYKADHYPVVLTESEEIIQAASNINLDRYFQDFRIKWGIIDVITSAAMRILFARHRYGHLDLDDAGEIRDIISKASINYKTLSHDPKVQALSKIKYRNGLRESIYKLADELVND